MCLPTSFILTDINHKMITLFGRSHTVVSSEIQKNILMFHKGACYSLHCTVGRFESLPAEQQLSMESKTSNLSKDMRLKQLNQSQSIREFMV